jgi:transcriptional regulator GlxA family with amidase domain
MVITDNRVTTAGAGFGHVDLALAIVRLISPALADLVASYMVIDERPSQSGYTIPSALAQNDPVVAACERWARERLYQPINLADVVKSLGVSKRTLQRSVQRTLATSPIRFIQDLRVEQASHPAAHHDNVPRKHCPQGWLPPPEHLRVLIRQRTGRSTTALHVHARDS